ncbi:hypothetical protein L198_05247 [Cryptococcus wingfieldii CBS 7118]|uniref:JmjC domain-containing protein n=1 Tax=Cryptococcus wingfieldii CBS 7118 TaxID=1295528 RepID=A0A1E3IY86_9TREE|nr:hypothetical protein L198_05247 [Cryptococcus wingfieldii CBS 7118]ODN93385.1 hypothetical protein L198_05247 [Cryptococcus wingfieldii CBS 7118]
MDADLVAIATSISEELLDSQSPTQKEIALCGPAVVRILLAACLALLPYQISELDPVEPELDAKSLSAGPRVLCDLAQQHIDSIPFNLVPPRWLRLYTDAYIISTLIDIVCHQSIEGQQKILRLGADIQQLDKVIIVAGALGPGRHRWVQTLIKKAQAVVSGTEDDIAAEVPQETIFSSSQKSNSNPSTAPDPNSSLLHAPNHIEVLQKIPSMRAYESRHSHSPFIIRRYASQKDYACFWPATELWSSPKYLLEQAGAGRVVPVEIGGAYDQANWGQEIVPFESFLERAGFNRTFHQKRSTPSTCYLAQYDIFNQIPELAKDICYPDYVWSEPSRPSTGPAYSPPHDSPVVNVWVGNGSGEIISPAHTDPYHNCYVQVLGSKRVWLAPPWCSDHMYCYGAGDDDSTSYGLAEQYMTNTSRVPLLRDPVEFEKESLRFPAFFETVRPQSMEAVLNPGDLLVFPPGWWHAMRTEGEGPVWSVSMWY